jgi:hypothetical protein
MSLAMAVSKVPVTTPLTSELSHANELMGDMYLYRLESSEVPL